MTQVEALSAEVADLARQVRESQAEKASLRSLISTLEGTIAALQSALVNHANENELLKRRLFGPRSERSDTSELQLTLGGLLADHSALKKKLDALTAARDEAAQGQGAAGAPPAEPKARPTPKGRRNLALSKLPVVEVKIDNPALAEQGRCIGYEETRQLLQVRAETKVLLLRVAKYEVTVAGEKTVQAADPPRTLFPRSMLHASMYAHLAVQKFALGVPHHRLEQHLAAQGCQLDRGTMCRKMEELGNTLGCTVVAAMLRDAKDNCRVLSTDATGALIQPGRGNGGPKRDCKKGHFFTLVADCDHVLFAYTERHTQAAVAELFDGYRGLLQCDASSVYDVLERGPPADNDQAEETLRLVGCWSHYPASRLIRRDGLRAENTARPATGSAG